MSIEQTLFEQLRKEIVNLIDENLKLKMQLKEQLNSVTSLKSEVQVKSTEIKMLSDKIETLELSRAITGNSKSNKKINHKLNSLINEVESCIRQLKNK